MYGPVHNLLIRKFYSLKNISAYCGYSPTSPFFLLLSEHKRCDNTATNSKSVNSRSRMVASLWGSMGTGMKEDESSTGCIWDAGLHHVMSRSCLARVLKVMNRLFNLPKFFRAAANRGYVGPPVYRTWGELYLYLL
jgi:hypothetical protein